MEDVRKRRRKRRNVVNYVRPVPADSTPQEVTRALIGDQGVERGKALLEGVREEHPPLQIILRGLDIEGEEKQNLETAIRQVIVEEMIKEIEEQQALPLGSQGYEDAPPRPETALSVSLRELNLPTALVERTENRVQERVQPLVAPYVSMASQCICTVLPADVRELSFLFLQPDGSLAPAIPPDDPNSVLEVILHYTIPHDYENYDLFYLDPHPQRLPELRPDEMIIGLRTDMEWPKELEAYNYCHGRQYAVYQDGPSGVAIEMRITKPGGCGMGLTDTIVFRKPKFLGIWTSVGWINSSNFWAAAGGHRITFRWFADVWRG